ncbi:MAG: peroxiredoxin [Verrucomicrobia bacterium]|nr:MAG: peroxiredoxin [Verrucomicrobiota bacterium]
MKRFLSLFILLFTMSSASPVKSVNVGDSAPLAAALDHTGSLLTLADVYQKNKYTLVYFYPRADTPGCTAQGCSLRDAYQKLTEKGVAVIGVSTDSVADQAAFREKHRLPFSLLADTEKAVLSAFGVGSFLGFSSRQAFLIHEGKVVYADHKGSTKQQADDVLGFLAKP